MRVNRVCFHDCKVDAPCQVPLGWVLPYMGYVGMCGPKGYGFSAVLLINGALILAILVIIAL